MHSFLCNSWEVLLLQMMTNEYGKCLFPLLVALVWFGCPSAFHSSQSKCLLSWSVAGVSHCSPLAVRALILSLFPLCSHLRVLVSAGLGSGSALQLLGFY